MEPQRVVLAHPVVEEDHRNLSALVLVEEDHHNHQLMDQVVVVHRSLAAQGLVGRPLPEGAFLHHVALVEALAVQDPYHQELEEDHRAELDQSDYSQNS